MHAPVHFHQLDHVTGHVASLNYIELIRQASSQYNLKRKIILLIFLMFPSIFLVPNIILKGLWQKKCVK
jgi:hypothetical protein